MEAAQDRHVWMHKTDADDRWTVFNEPDQVALDNALDDSPVPVIGGRYDAFVNKRLVKSVYHAIPIELQIIKAVWFEEDVPFSEPDSLLISQWDLLSSEPFLFLGDRKVYRSEDKTVFISGIGLLSVSRRVLKFGNPDCPLSVPKSVGDDPTVACRHLIITVHGIGEALWSRKAFNLKPFERNCGILRNLLSEHLNVSSSDRIDVLPVTWFHILSESVYMQRMTDITLNTIPVFRQIANGAVSDVIFYLNERHRQKIVSHVIERISQIVSAFKTRNPSFNGRPVSLIGHSLGSVICFDALSSPNFPPEIHIENLFMFGSPLGMFLTARDQVDMFPLSKCGKVFNIIQPNDPVCYRIEPLLVGALKDVEPAILPYHKTGGLAATTQIRKTAVSIMGLFSSDSDSTYLERLSQVVNGPPSPKAETPVAIGLKSIEKLNNGSRIDWTVQQGFMPVGTEYADALTAHISYFDNRDVAKFIHENCN